MNLFDLPLDQFQKFLTVFFRTGSILIFAPFFGSRNIPARVKVGASFLLSVIVYPFVAFEGIVFPSNILPLAILISGEVMIGAVIGYASRLFFAAIQVAGHLMGFQIGYAIVNVIDPQTSSQVSVISQFQNIVVMLIFLTTGAYGIFIHAIAESFTIIPPLGFTFSNQIFEIILRLFSDCFVLALKLSSPVMAAILFTNVALGLVARTVPQINVFIVGMPVQIGIGLFMIGVTMTYILPLLDSMFLDMEGSIYMLLRAMSINRI